MELLDHLRSDHDLIDRALGSLRTYARLLVAGEAPLAEASVLVRFFEVYAGRWHHENEEGILFRALVAEAMLPADRGPLAVLLEAHESFGATLAAMRRAIAEGDVARFAHLAFEYSDALWNHIDAENSVLFPESERHLRRAGVAEVKAPEMPAEVAEIAVAALALATVYPPSDSEDALRGEGCALCPAYGPKCSGIEREWWNVWDWEELEEHVAAN